MAKWTEEQDNQLKVLHATGLTYDLMAAEFGKTRGSIAGRCKRLKLVLPPEEASRRHNGGIKLGTVRVPLAAKPKQQEAPWRPTDLPEPDNAFHCTIIELDHRRCRFPIGEPDGADFRYCGHKTEKDGASYCPYHAAVAYRPEQRKRAA